jgi:hypothetical protein
MKIMIQMTIFHQILWNILSVGSALNEHSIETMVQWLIDRKSHNLPNRFARIFS